MCGGGSRIHRLHLCRGVKLSTNECPVYDTKQSGGDTQVMLELWVMWSAPSLPLLPSPLWPGMVEPDRVLSMDNLDLNYLLMLNRIVSDSTVFDI